MVAYWLVGEGAQAPERHEGAGLDLHARLPGRPWRLVWGFSRIAVGVALHMERNAVVRVTGRSGGFMRGIIVHDGLIESEFNGRELCALLYCPWPRIVRHGDRIAQMWPLPMDRDSFQFLERPPVDLDPGKAGFGSTGR